MLLIRSLGFGFAGAFAVMMTILLLYVMQSLISSGRKVMTVESSLNLVEFVRTAEEDQLELKRRKPKPPPAPDELPPNVPEVVDFKSNVDTSAWNMNTNFDVEMPTIASGPGMTVSNGEYLPLVKVQPIYPRAALERGLEGWVMVEFTVNDIGAVENAAVIEHCAFIPRDDRQCDGYPNPIFDKAALKAASKFKYKPRFIDGVAVATAGVKNMITFELEDE